MVMATIKDIARLTGVSTATVSNVLNGKINAASPAKAREIIDAAGRLHYTPNLLAKSLKKQRTNNIGIITEDLTVFNTPEIVDGIDAYCKENGYEIILGNMRLFKRYNNDFTDTIKYQQILDDMVSNMLSKQVEGIVYVGHHCREISYLPSLVTVPMVYAYCFPKENTYPSVMYNDEKASLDLTNLLISKGHKSVGVITGPPASFHTIHRLKGFQKALFQNGILFNTDMVFNGDWARHSGYSNTDALLNAGVSAIFCFNDLMASGVYERCTEKGLVIGKDISLVGFDNREISLGYSPHISTVEPPLNEIGRKSAELVLTQIKTNKALTDQVYLDCILHIRGSISELTP